VQALLDGSLLFVMRDVPPRATRPRELGALQVQDGVVRLVIPRVHADRTVAQLRPRRAADSLLHRLSEGEDEVHMMVCEGLLPTSIRRREILTLRGTDSGAVVLKLSRGANGTAIILQLSSPLSAFQALCVALCIDQHTERQRQRGDG